MFAMWTLDLTLIKGAEPVAPISVAAPAQQKPVQRAPPVQRVERVERVPSPELGTLFSAYEPPPKRAKSAPPQRVAKPEREVIPYHQRIVARPKAPFDPRHPFRHAGLMRDIGGVHKFMAVVRGTHRIGDEWETTSELVVLN